MSESGLGSETSPQNEERHQGELFHIAINNNRIAIHRGRHSVAGLKALGSIPTAYVLIKVIDGTFHQ